MVYWGGILIFWGRLDSCLFECQEVISAPQDTSLLAWSRGIVHLGTPIHSGERSLRPYGEIEVRPKHNHIGIHDQLCATAVQQDLEMAAWERLAADRGLLGWYFDILG